MTWEGSLHSQSPPCPRHGFPPFKTVAMQTCPAACIKSKGAPPLHHARGLCHAPPPSSTPTGASAALRSEPPARWPLRPRAPGGGGGGQPASSWLASAPPPALRSEGAQACIKIHPACQNHPAFHTAPGRLLVPTTGSHSPRPHPSARHRAQGPGRLLVPATSRRSSWPHPSARHQVHARPRPTCIAETRLQALMLPGVLK